MALPLVFFPYDLHMAVFVVAVGMVATVVFRRHRQRLQDIQATLARLDKLTEEFSSFQGPDRRQPKHWA